MGKYSFLKSLIFILSETYFWKDVFSIIYKITGVLYIVIYIIYIVYSIIHKIICILLNTNKIIYAHI